jgi:FecR protein
MKTFKGILSVVVVLAMVSTSALVATAQGPDQGQGQAQEQVQGPNQAPNQGPNYDQNQAPPQNQNQNQNPNEDQNQAMPPGPNSNDAPPQGSPQNDPPAVAARLQFMTGSVSVQPHGTDAWVAGVINRPLTNSDNVWADKNSRAEINVGSALIRIDSESSLTLTNVSENAVQLQLHQGAMNLHVRSLEDGETYEVDTQNQAFTVQQPGDYRFDVNPDADTTVVTVWQGQGQSTGNGPAVLVHENEQARFSNGTSLKVEMHAAPGTDAFDDWAQSRDERFDHSASDRYVSPDVVGSQDLDEYGQWQNSPDYGNVWVPSRVDVGWAPYRNGHWISVAPWGWTWVEDEPWGYAPFHYGRWVYFNNYWGWAPGPIYGRPYYSPALVAFYGGRGWGVGLGFGFGGGFGWCPLGFGEPFVPWYGVSRGYFNRVNITNTHITNINNVYNHTYVNRGGFHGGEPLHYANMRAPNGFTAVSRDTMINSRSVARNNVRVSPSEFNRLSPTRTLDVQPTRNTMLGANAGRPAAVPPSRTFARPVYSNGTSVRGGSDVVRDRNYSMGPNGGGPNSNVRMPDRSAGSPRFVPRPPNAGGTSSEGRTNQGGMNGGTNGGMNQDRGYQGGSNQNIDRGNSRPGYNQGGSSPRSDVYEGGRQPASQGSYSRPAPSSGGGSYSGPAPTYDRGSSDRGSYGGGRASGGGSNGGGSRPSGGGRASAPAHSSGGGGSSHGGGPRGRH